MQGDNLIVIKLAETKIPEFKKVSNKGYVTYGDDDKYNDYLLTLFNKSAKHNAIVSSKANYIIGGGVKSGDALTQEWLDKVNSAGETMTDILRKTVLDIGVFGGFAWEIIYNGAGEIQDIFHLHFGKVRSNEDNTHFFYKRNWADRKEDIKEYPAFDPEYRVNSIYYFGEYRPGYTTYPVPEYIGATNYIEADIEVSKHTLTNSKSGFSGSKFVNFYNGEPEEDKKRLIEKRFNDKFSGAEGQKIIIAFNNDTVKAPTVTDLGTSDLTKEDFSAVDNLISSNIYAGHQITSPILFGIKEAGQLGGATELQTAYEIFKNTYITAKQLQLERIIGGFAILKGLSDDIGFTPVEPVGVQFSEATILQAAPRSWILEKLGIDPTIYPDASAAGIAPPTEEAMVNDHLKNMTGRQWQQLQRVVRKFKKGEINEAQAAVMLKSFNLSEEDIHLFLHDEDDAAFGKQYTEEEVAELFAECGEGRDAFEVIKTKRVDFKSDKEMMEDELMTFQALHFDLEGDAAKGAAGIGITEAIRRKINDIKKVTKVLPKIVVKYSYEPRPGLQPVIETTRPFCRKLLQLDRFYSRTEIEKISERLGYSVFDRRGGFWGDKPYCRHIWKSNILIQK